MLYHITEIVITGSGKTYTMEALEQRIARDIFPAAEVLSARFLATHNTHGGQNTTEPNTIGTTKSIFKITVTFLELLGKKATDLLAVARMENDDTQDESVSDEAPKEVPIIENKVILALRFLIAFPNKADIGPFEAWRGPTSAP